MILFYHLNGVMTTIKRFAVYTFNVQTLKLDFVDDVIDHLQNNELIKRFKYQEESQTLFIIFQTKDLMSLQHDIITPLINELSGSVSIYLI